MSALDLFNNVLEVLAIAIRRKRKEAGKRKTNSGEREREKGQIGRDKESSANLFSLQPLSTSINSAYPLLLLCINLVSPP